jgi:uncharacterized phage protein gp47/JayE
MANRVGKIYVPKSSNEIRDQFLRDIRLTAFDTGVSDPPITPGTDWYLLGNALANIALIQFANANIASDDSDVLTATGDALDDKRKSYGLPEARAAGSSGRVVVTISGGGSTTFTGGTALVLPNGKRAEVSGTQSGIADRGEIDIVAVDSGDDTNFPGGTAGVRFVSPPLNVSTDCVVSKTSPLTGGTDAEDDARKRTRILNRIQNTPNGSNWASVREIVLNNVPAVQDVYVYPALGGPGSLKAVCVKDVDVDNRDFSRTPTAAQITAARAALQAEMPTGQEVVVNAAASLNASVTVKITIPESSLSGGNGLGWTDQTPWPPLTGAETAIPITSVPSPTNIEIDALTTTPPIAGQTQIAWWSSNDQKFRTYLVTGVSGSSGAWVLTLDSPMVDDSAAEPSVGDYVCPAAANLDKYGATWVQIMRGFGAGENTSDPNRVPRALRHPLASTSGGAPTAFTVLQLKQLIDAHPEITDAALGLTSPSTTTVPASVDDPPNVLRPFRFAVYKKV